MNSSLASRPTAFPGITDLNRARDLRTLAALLLVPGLLAVVGGGGIALVDLADTTDDWHGLGIWIGMIVAVPSAFCAVVGIVVILGVGAALRGSVPRALSNLRALQVALVLVAALLGAVALFALPTFGSLVLVPGAVIVLVVVMAAVISNWIGDLTERLR